MKRKKLNMAQYGMLAPNVQRGGQAIPIGDNLYLMKGRQHSAGGIDIGKDLEVENNEVMQMLPNETRVFSSMPMLGGYSPAQLVANGNNPDLVFNAQERWKKENRVRDDGSTYKDGGIHINPVNKGKFTAQAKQHGMGVQSFANKVLAHKENYSPTTVKRATFAKYIGGRKPFGGISRLAKLGKRIKGVANDGSRDIYYDYDKKRWVFGLNRTVLPYGHKVRLSDGEEYQLNSDGTMTRKFKVNIYNDTKNGQVLDKKETIAHRSMDVEDARNTVNYKNRILYDKNREMVLTSDDPRFRAQNVKISEALLDTLANASKRNNLPFSTVAGLAYRESTLGANLTDEYRDPYYKAGYVTPGDLFTINSYMQDNPYRELMNNYKGNEKDFDAAFNRAEQKMEAFNVDENPIDYALRQFKEGNYNRGDKNYYNKVANDTQILLTSPQIREYMTKHNLKKAGGTYKRRKAKAGELNVDLPGITVYQALQETPPNFIDKAIYNLGAKMIDYNSPEMYDFLNLYKDTFDKNGKLTEEGRNNIERDLKWYKSRNDDERDFLLESAYEKILNGENSFAVNAFGELVSKEKIMNEAAKLEHEWRMKNDRAYRDKINNAGETFDNRYDRISNLPIAEGDDLYDALSWQYDQNNLENQELEKNKADRLAYNQHKSLTESFALPFYMAGALPGLTALPGVLGPFLAAHDAEAIAMGIPLGFAGLLGSDLLAAKYDQKAAYNKKMEEIKDYINTPWVSNAIKEARTDIDKSANIMSQIRADWLLNNEEKYKNGKLPFIKGYSVGGDGYPQNSFLLNRDLQREYLLSNGYIEKPGDYGLVQQAVKNTGRDIPVYQQMQDYIDRKDLTPIGNLWNDAFVGNSNEGWIANSEPLEHAGDYKTALYIDNNTGNFYQKAWDLNDYSGGRQGLEGNGLDAIGNPIVVTTGFQPVDAEKILELENNKEFEPTDSWEEVLNKLKQRKQYGGKTRNMNLQNIYDNSLARLGKRINGSIVRMDGNGIDKLAYIPFMGNRLKTLKAGGRRIAEKGIRYPVRTRKNSATNIDDILEERMKYVEPYFEGQSDIPGYIAAGINGLGSVVTSLIANNAINKQRPPVEPMPLIAPKLKTNFNINADLDANREATGLAIHNIKKNTASSQVGRNLINQQLFAKALADSKLYTDKENKETELINADITQRAAIANKNIEMGNTYRQALADFYSNRALAKGQNWAQMVNGLGQAIGMGLNNIGATNTKKLNALIAMLPAIETFMKNKES